MAERKPPMTQIDLHEMALRGARRRLAALEAMKATDIQSEAERRFRATKTARSEITSAEAWLREYAPESPLLANAAPTQKKRGKK